MASSIQTRSGADPTDSLKISHTHLHLIQLSGLDVQGEIVQLRERVTRLETRLDELVKKMDALSAYQRQLYDYLQSQRR